MIFIYSSRPNRMCLFCLLHGRRKQMKIRCRNYSFGNVLPTNTNNENEHKKYERFAILGMNGITLVNLLRTVNTNIYICNQHSTYATRDSALFDYLSICVVLT